MELVFINTFKHLSIYEKEWLAILEANQNTNPFLEYEYVYSLWEALGEEKGVEIYAVKEHNRIIAFFPFQFKQTWFGYKLYFIAQDEGNCMDIIAKDRDKDRIIMFVFDALIKRKKSIVFSLNGLLESGDTLNKLSRYLQARSMKEYSRVDAFQLNYKYIPKESSNAFYTKVMFSTNTLRAKTYRNILWTKEMVTAKFIRKSKMNG
ncbi:hypothetical protein SAMN05518871_10978 [Psychrobacillus sp. OK028]|uniref:hypothetical protein n=1 Tax=Psychrobacillus sp. OK028 TaxID=1884359 RepID=UPI00088B09A0|nr:hypothetical protein [Psychrobacillus sp. OK028]SDO00405.1 hypothetical protein SAMN05518871_10978 [Psychrobacillus sp. OK028]